MSVESFGWSTSREELWLSRPGDLIHADRHGAVVIPERVAADLPAAAKLLAKREKILLVACKRDGF